MKIARFLFLGLLIIVTISSSLYAKDLSARIIVTGPGDPIYTFWGHIGLAIRDNTSGQELFYDFGNFSFFSDNFYRDFVMGRMLYLGIVKDTDNEIAQGVRDNRDIYAYPLMLGDSEIQELNLLLRKWVQPENREYLYDYYRNNCSTIIRDVLNQVLDDQIKSSASRINDINYRHYTRTASHNSLLLNITLYYLLGPLIDKPISAWELMFLPEATGDFILGFEYVGRDGQKRTLSEEKIILNTSDRSPVPENKNPLFPPLLLIGIIYALLWTLLPKGIIRKIVRTLIILSIGLPGLFLSLVMVFTDHASTYNNVNVWPSFPTILLALIPLYASRLPRAEDISAWIWTLNLVGLGLAILLVSSGLVKQDAAAMWGFYLPISLVASYPSIYARKWSMLLSRSGILRFPERAQIPHRWQTSRQ